MKNVFKKRVLVFASVFCLLAGSISVNASSSEVFNPGKISSKSVCMIEEDLEVVNGTLETYATITIYKEGPGLSETSNDTSYGATMHTNRNGSFTTSLNPSSNVIQDKGKVGTHTVTRISSKGGLLSVVIIGCKENPTGLYLVEGTQFTLEEGKTYRMIMSF